MPSVRKLIMYMSSRGEIATSARHKIVLAVHGLGRGNAKVQHHQRHGNRKDAVAEGRQPLHALARDPVVQSGHGD